MSGGLSLSVPQMTDMFLSPFFEGFTGATCSFCGGKANVIASNGWFCECLSDSGHPYNLKVDRRRPHERPAYGPSGADIRRAMRLAQVTEVVRG